MVRGHLIGRAIVYRGQCKPIDPAETASKPQHVGSLPGFSFGGAVNSSMLGFRQFSSSNNSFRRRLAHGATPKSRFTLHSFFFERRVIWKRKHRWRDLRRCRENWLFSTPELVRGASATTLAAQSSWQCVGPIGRKSLTSFHLRSETQ